VCEHILYDTFALQKLNLPQSMFFENVRVLETNNQAVLLRTTGVL